MFTRLSHARGSRVFYAEQGAGERWLQLFRAHKMPTVPVTVWYSTDVPPIKSNIALIQEKPLVRAAFLLCKKVQVFVVGYGDVSVRAVICAIWENGLNLFV